MTMNTSAHSTNDPKAAARTPRADDLVNTAGAYSANGSQSLPSSDSATPSATTATNSALMDQQRKSKPPEQVIISAASLPRSGRWGPVGHRLLGGFAPRLSKSKVAAADTAARSPTVSLVSPTVGSPPAGLMLPAEVRPWQEASIFSRVNGYLKTWYGYRSLC
jgi:hypothetical protein